MRAMILAAGRGERMQPLTDHVPKPLLKVHGKPLIQYHVERLVQAGIGEIVINHALMGEQIESFLGNGELFNAKIRYSPEGTMPLDTAGGIKQALPLLGNDPFIAVNADIWTDFNFASLPSMPRGQAHLVLTGNPDHHPEGDFCLKEGIIVQECAQKLTFTGIGVYRPELFLRLKAPVYPLGRLLREAVSRGHVSGEVYRGLWVDIGTPQRLKKIQSI